MAYYVLKVVREALILGEGSAELKTYMSAGQVVVLAVAVPAYGRLVASCSRMRLINVVTAFFVGCLLLFYVLAQFHVPLAIVYFIWIGVFNLMVVAQFWSFANDIYSKDEGERLFAIVGFGASLGAVVGARAAASADRAVRGQRADAARRRRCCRAGAAHQPHRRARTGAALRARPAAAKPAVRRRRPVRPTPSRWCSGPATCC